MKTPVRVAAVLVGLLAGTSFASAEPMECSEDNLRMALGGRGTLPAELLRECARMPAEHPDYGLTQYMVSVHFRRRRNFGKAAYFLDRAARTAPFVAHPRVLYLLAQYQIAAGHLEDGLVAKDRFLSHSGALTSSERMRKTSNLYGLLHDVYEIRALEASDPDEYERDILAARFYEQARSYLKRELQRGEGAVALAPIRSSERR